MQLSPFPAGLFCLFLAACGTPTPPPAPAIPSAADPTPGFADKEPDTCHSAGLQGLLGQPSGMLRTVPVTGPVRIIDPGTVYDQEEYRSDRINVFVDGAGLIRRINCG